jgi:hypothetical protein
MASPKSSVKGASERSATPMPRRKVPEEFKRTGLVNTGGVPGVAHAEQLGHALTLPSLTKVERA